MKSLPTGVKLSNQDLENHGLKIKNPTPCLGVGLSEEEKV